jgi:PAS domain S-box-containing protein
MDSNEILAATRYRAGLIVGMVAVLIVLAGAATAYGYKRQQALLLRSLIEAERRQRELHDEFRTTLYSIGDGVITTDTAGRVREMNRVAEQLTGWKETEAKGRPLEEVFRIVNETTRALVVNPVNSVLRDGVIVGLANHTLLLARDGTEWPIADSAAPIRAAESDPVSGVVLIFRDQTAEHDAVKALLEREQMLQESQKVAALGSYVLDFSKGAWKSSAILDELWGIEADYDRSVAGWISIVAPADRTMMAGYFTQEVVGKAVPFDKEYRIVRPKDGTERWVHGLGKLEFDSKHQPTRMVGTIRDITQQRQLAETLRSSQAELTAIYDHAPIIMCLLDEERRIVHLNRAAVQLTKRGPEALLGLRSGDLIGCIHAYDDGHGCEPDLNCADCTLRNAILDTLKTGQSHLGVEAELPVVGDLKPKKFHVIAHTALLEIGGQKRVLLCMADDTSRKHAAAAMREIEEKLRQVQKIEAVGQLAGGVAHDFNNIMAAVLLYIGLLQNDPSVSGEIHDTLKELEKEVQRGASLTKQLLAFSRQQAMELKVVDLDDVLGGLLKMLQRLLGEQIVLSLRQTEKLPRIEADIAMLEVVVINLCVNARDAMPKGGQVTLNLEVVEVSAKAAGAHAEARDGRFIRLSVSDTGCGIDEKTIGRIFEPFFTTKEVGKGTGLGLATVHGIVKQHRGWVEVRSVVGKGSTFHVYLPVSEASALNTNPAEKPRIVKGRQEMILLVEDEPAVRSGLAKILRYHDYQVTEAANGPEALRHWKLEPAKFDLLFTDMSMPEGMSGMELAERCREDRPDLKVIVYTGYSQALTAHPFDAKMRLTLLHKPCDTGQLLAAVRRSIDESIAPKLT